MIFIVGIYTLMKLRPAGWGCGPRQYEYEQMILGIYATLGVSLLIASRDAMAHRSLISFTIWSSVGYGAIMAVQAVVDSVERPNLLGDVPALFIAAIVLATLMPRERAKRSRAQNTSYHNESLNRTSGLAACPWLVLVR